MNFLLWENIGQKNWENFVLEENRNYYFGKILGNIKSSFHLSQFFFGFGKCFSKNGKTLGTELLNVLDFPKSRNE